MATAKPLRLLHPRLAAHLGVLVVAWCAPGCVVSFDGYSLAPGAAGAEIGGVPEGGASDTAGGGTSGVAPGGTGNDSGESQTAGGASAGDTGAPTAAGQSGVSPAGEGGFETGGADARGVGAGGSSTGGADTGGYETGGTETGGHDRAGADTGGYTGGAHTGGRDTGGASTGGADTGGVSTGGASTGGSSTGGGPACPVGLAGPMMAEIPKPDGGYFCIDRTEVTNAQYAEFVAAGDTAEQPTYCSFNTSFAPQSNAECPTLRYDPIGRAQYPVSCVDWCDAHAFCAWAGKHLCGDMAGGPVAPANFANASRDEWYAACSQGGTQLYPYAGAYQPEGCADLYYPAVYPIETATTPTCEGGYANVFDLSGNVSEWEDSCTATDGGFDTCVHRGGSYLDADDTSPSVRCNSADADEPDTVTPALRARQSRSIAVGFRCCWDP
jgi:sulfatase modifying factor 1